MTKADYVRAVLVAIKRFEDADMAASGGLGMRTRLILSVCFRYVTVCLPSAEANYLPNQHRYR